MTTHVPDGHVETPAPAAARGGASPPPSASSPPEGWHAVLPRALVMLLGAAAAVIVLTGLRATAWLIGPAFLALVLVVAVSPVQGWLRRHGWPGWLATIVLICLVAGLLVGFALVVLVSLAKLAALLPQYADRADELLQSLAASLERFGVQPAQLQDAVADVSPARLVTAIGDLLAGLSGAVSSLVFLVCLLLFLSIEASGMDRRVAAGARDPPRLAPAPRSFARGPRPHLPGR